VDSIQSLQGSKMCFNGRLLGLKSRRVKISLARLPVADIGGDFTSLAKTYSKLGVVCRLRGNDRC